MMTAKLVLISLFCYEIVIQSTIVFHINKVLFILPLRCVFANFILLTVIFTHQL